MLVSIKVVICQYGRNGHGAMSITRPLIGDYREPIVQAGSFPLPKGQLRDIYPEVVLAGVVMNGMNFGHIELHDLRDNLSRRVAKILQYTCRPSSLLHARSSGLSDK